MTGKPCVLVKFATHFFRSRREYPACWMRGAMSGTGMRCRTREEDEHVNRYVSMLDTPAVYNSRWMVK